MLASGGVAAALVVTCAGGEGRGDDLACQTPGLACILLSPMGKAQLPIVDGNDTEVRVLNRQPSKRMRTG